MTRFFRFAAAALCAMTALLSVSDTQAALPGRPDRDQITFAYLQAGNSGDIRGVRWGAITHLGWCFVYFTEFGTLTSLSSFNARSSELKPGGVASNNGTKIIMVLANGPDADGTPFSETTLTACMTNPARRSTLVTNIVSAVSNATNGCDGVSLDLEFSWNATTRDGISAFLAELGTQLKALSPPRELSIYTTPSWSSTQYSAAALNAYCDYVIPSGYDYASGSTMTAKGRYGNSASFSIVGNTDDYIAAGIPPEKIVIALPFYTGLWTTTSTGSYGQTGTAYSAGGYNQANFDTTYKATPDAKFDSSPLDHYTKWYRYLVSGPTYRLVTFDDFETLEYKMRMVKSWPGANSKGKRLGGIAFWSLSWIVETSSVDPNNTGAGSQSLTRTASEPYMLMEELYAPASYRNYRAETFEHISADTEQGFNARWRDPDEGPDDQNVDTVNTTRAPAAAPSGAPSGSNEVMAVTFRFTATPNRFFFKHQALMDTQTPYRVDWGNALVAVTPRTKFLADIHVPSGYAGTTIRMVVRDGNLQLEKGPAFSLTTSGWRQISFDLANDPVTAYTTTEGGYTSGNGVLDSAGGGKRDITFAGFEVSSTGFTGSNGTINFDRILYTPSNPSAQNYVINELRYSNTNSQFVEIYGPAGAIPSGTLLRVVNGASGTTTTEIALSGSIPNDTGGGFGYWVVGNSGVPNVDQIIPSSTLLANSPSALQLYHVASGTILDSVVYQAFTGLGSCDTPGNPIVGDRGPGWMGAVASGQNSSAVPYTVGRYPSGTNTGENAKDFSFMPATPGANNGGSVTLPVNYNFDSAPANAFRTFAAFSVVPNGSIPVQVGSSPSGGGVHRCADTGGGTLSVFGDAALGTASNGYKVTGEVFIPANGTASDANAIGLGICGRLGSNFFGTTADAGYDSGYWIIYENATGVGLADGQADHAGSFDFVWANNDGLSSQTKRLVGAPVTLATTGATAGAWTNFELSINPSAPAASQLVAKIKNVVIYSGAIPTGGPTTGAFQAGFRENHAGATLAYEGTWIDNVSLTTTPNSTVGDWPLY
ncbi:MAG: hypothetical protein K1X53_08500 [Candidatus Sumerlaeaceae bacterium]|nr:hypothetical protein [Candidatus Sumerlaeaceae bacterium]